MTEEKEPEIKVEEGEVLAYMDAEPDAGDEAVFAKYLDARYEQVKQEYQTLLFQQREMEGRGSKDDGRLAAGFKENFKARKYLVLEIRKRGKEIKDRFIL